MYIIINFVFVHSVLSFPAFIFIIIMEYYYDIVHNVGFTTIVLIQLCIYVHDIVHVHTSNTTCIYALVVTHVDHNIMFDL